MIAQARGGDDELAREEEELNRKRIAAGRKPIYQYTKPPEDELVVEEPAVEEEPVSRRGKRPEPEPTPEELEVQAEAAKWHYYGISPDTPPHEKVERLHTAFDFNEAEIVEVIPEVKPEQIRRIIKRLHERWEKLGQELSEDERRLARGKQIAGLEALQLQLEREYARTGDAKMLTAKLTVTQKLGELRDLEGKRVKEEEEQARSRDVLERAVMELSTQDAEALLARCQAELSLLQTTP